AALRLVSTALFGSPGLLGAVSACTTPAGGLSQEAVGAALPDPPDIGTGWSLVGTTKQRPTDTPPGDALRDAAANDPACYDALVALSALDQEGHPARFARAVYRHPADAGPSGDRDLTLTVETYETPPDAAARVRAVTNACTQPLTTAAGIRKVTMTVAPHAYATTNAVGYTVDYSTNGLRYAYDYVVATRGHATITASVTGPSRTANELVLERAISLASARLDAAQGDTPG
ncbi:MAG: hypothetical protein Q4P32_05830, partial [Micrococcales bacterium]|nr:hypothetical protein [Micrococcales bacterium]